METIKDLTQALKDSYSLYSLDPPDQAKCRLIGRYSHKVSQRLIDERERLIKEGRVKWDKIFTEEMLNPNLLFRSD